jgi:hypothetical protein
LRGNLDNFLGKSLFLAPLGAGRIAGSSTLTAGRIAGSARGGARWFPASNCGRAMVVGRPAFIRFLRDL